METKVLQDNSFGVRYRCDRIPVLIPDVSPLEHTYLDDRALKNNQLRPIRFVCVYVVDGI